MKTTKATKVVVHLPANQNQPRRTLIYHTYNFIEKDPVIDLLRTRMECMHMTMKELASRSGVSESTLKGWFSGSTRRPQFATCQAVARALGADFKLTVAR
jgi:AraC-like DNA-binding protein